MKGTVMRMDRYTEREHQTAAERLAADAGVTLDELDTALKNWRVREPDHERRGREGRGLDQ